MAKIPRRDITEYRKDVQKARVRRKIKEKENAKRLVENGEYQMTIRQDDMLMKQGALCLHYTSDDTDFRDRVQVPAISAIIIDEDTMPENA